jgi:hypothetical protein
MGFLFDSLRKKNAQRYAQLEDMPQEDAAPAELPVEAAPVMAGTMMQPISVPPPVDPNAPTPSYPSFYEQEKQRVMRERGQDTANTVSELPPARTIERMWEMYNKLLGSKR